MKKMDVEKKVVKTSSDYNKDVDKVMMENFVGLQKVLTNLVIKFDNLSDQIGKLLDLFEISAKAMAEKDFEQFKGTDNKEMLEKMDKLLEQNKVIAKGLTLMHERTAMPEMPRQMQPEPPRGMPPDMQRGMPPKQQGLEGYRPSQRI